MNEEYKKVRTGFSISGVEDLKRLRDYSAVSSTLSEDGSRDAVRLVVDVKVGELYGCPVVVPYTFGIFASGATHYYAGGYSDDAEAVIVGRGDEFLAFGANELPLRAKHFAAGDASIRVDYTLVKNAAFRELRSRYSEDLAKIFEMSSAAGINFDKVEKRPYVRIKITYPTMFPDSCKIAIAEAARKLDSFVLPFEGKKNLLDLNEHAAAVEALLREHEGGELSEPELEAIEVLRERVFPSLEREEESRERE